MRHFFVYILTNFNNTVLYVGITNNLVRRFFEHKHGLNQTSFTKKYKLTKLVWYEEFPTAEEAIAVEKKIKGWIRVKKIELIKSKNPNFDDLSEKIIG